MNYFDLMNTKVPRQEGVLLQVLLGELLLARLASALKGAGNGKTGSCARAVSNSHVSPTCLGASRRRCRIANGNQRHHAPKATPPAHPQGRVLPSLGTSSAPCRTHSLPLPLDWHRLEHLCCLFLPPALSSDAIDGWVQPCTQQPPDREALPSAGTLWVCTVALTVQPFVRNVASQQADRVLLPSSLGAAPFPLGHSLLGEQQYPKPTQIQGQEADLPIEDCRKFWQPCPFVELRWDKAGGESPVIIRLDDGRTATSAGHLKVSIHLQALEFGL